MPVNRIHHHKIFVGDMERSIPFYRDLLGFELLQDVERANLPSYDRIMGFENVRVRVAMLKVPGQDDLLALLEFASPQKQHRQEQSIAWVGSQALALVVDDAQAEYERLSAKGARFQCPPVDIERDGKVVARACYIYDPDGLAHELYQPMS